MQDYQKQSRKVEVRKRTWKLSVLYDFTINSKYVILFQFESNKKSSKKRRKNSQKQNHQGGNATLRPVGGKVPNLPLKREFSKISGMTRDVIGFKME